MTSRTTTHLRRAAASAAVLAAGALPATLATPAASAATPGPAPLVVTTGTAAHGHGSDIFVTPSDDTPQTAAAFSNGAEILSPAGKELWFHAAAPGQVDADFRPQRLDGKPVLTFWEGHGFGGLSDGTDYVYNDHYRKIASVHAGNGLATDGHEFLLAPHGTAYVLSYGTSVADLSSIGGAADQTVINATAQRIDIKTGRVLWSWNAADHVPYAQSEEPLPTSTSTPWDWFHLNAVKFGPDGTLLIDARDTWTTYDVDKTTGAINWQLGGKASSFTLQAASGQTLNDAGEIFAWQHDPQLVAPDTLTVFDNESAGTANTGQGASAEFAISRVVTIKLDPSAHTATLVASDNQPDLGLASSQGNGQRLPGGGEFIGWGIVPSISQFSAAGKLVFHADFPFGVNTYRAYLLPWPGRHADRRAQLTHSR